MRNSCSSSCDQNTSQEPSTEVVFVVKSKAKSSGSAVVDGDENAGQAVDVVEEMRELSRQTFQITTKKAMRLMPWLMTRRSKWSSLRRRRTWNMEILKWPTTDVEYVDRGPTNSSPPS